MGAVMRTDVISPLHSLDHSFTATKTLIEIGKWDDNFRGKEKSMKEYCRGFPEEVTLKMSSFDSQPLPRARSVSLFPPVTQRS